ncbi:hypothetical protein BDB00DRAFT_857176 [Zychaea mexicana]|uniref:uncharacterized protein n=1 Tax=Zychaea mexicana TaxID=64656 RepID=UPI0022FDB40D|nr:uncharacterized protein BDB00DRAFT_857176 [Zychaea mexicana]KAI9482575.1 hypothetical protein BDB00DRAFT_857176 [Zychaea mexicana]
MQSGMVLHVNHNMSVPCFSIFMLTSADTLKSFDKVTQKGAFLSWPHYGAGEGHHLSRRLRILC